MVENAKLTRENVLFTSSFSKNSFLYRAKKVVLMRCWSYRIVSLSWAL